MPLPEPSPYTLLGVTPQSRPEEIAAAYRAAVEAGRTPLRLLAKAWNDLRDDRKRLEHDVMQWQEPGSESIDALDSLLETTSLLPDGPLPQPQPAALLRLAATDVADDFAQVPEPRTPFATPSLLAPSTAVLPRLPFPA